ncbi:MAG: hypothetical protein M3441_04045 [Chloroflexota bacterium]|nr:hypothetical protein [Chloroflexota bacterium]
MLSTLRERIEEASAPEADESLDLLVKHALKTNAPQAPAPNSNNVWSKLSSRVRGPFGKMAVEGPAGAGSEMSVLGAKGAPFSVGDETRSSLPSGSSQEVSDPHTALFPTAKEPIQLT